MTHEVKPAPEPSEHDAEIHDPYWQSAERLLDLLSTRRRPSYYKVDWESETSPNVRETTTMTVRPTGARKQLRRGEFYRAQLSTREISSSGEERLRLIWCYTGPQRVGTPIEADPGAMVEEYGYRPLTPNDIVDTLAYRTENVDDYITLTEALQRHGVKPSLGLVHGVRSLVREFVQSSSRGESDSSGTLAEREKVFRLMKMLQMEGPDIPRTLQGSLVGQLLRKILIVGKGVPEDPDGVDNAVSTLEAAIYGGVIAGDSIAMERILASTKLYRYLFMTELLHARMTAGQEVGTSQRIVGTNRVVFAHGYIVAVLQNWNTRLGPEMEKLFASQSRLAHNRDEGQEWALKGLCHLLDELSWQLGGPGRTESERKKSTNSHQVDSIPDINKAFAYVLSALHNHETYSTEAWPDFDRKCSEVVHMVLAPLIKKKIGGKVITVAQKSDRKTNG